MIYQRQVDLLERKKKLRWTNREIANILDVAPGVASSKLNGFIVLTIDERSKLEKAMTDAEHAAQAIAENESTVPYFQR